MFKKVNMEAIDLFGDVFAVFVDAYVSDKILKSDMNPVVKIIAAIPWIIQGTGNAVNFVNKVSDGKYKTEETSETTEET